MMNYQISSHNALGMFCFAYKIHIDILSKNERKFVSTTSLNFSTSPCRKGSCWYVHPLWCKGNCEAW